LIVPEASRLRQHRPDRRAYDELPWIGVAIAVGALAAGLLSHHIDIKASAFVTRGRTGRKGGLKKPQRP
jgi:hypothetical protein